jgi:hypothetical protein
VITSNDRESHVTLLESILCTIHKCSAPAVASQRRAFVKVNDGAHPLTNIKNAKNAAFLDLDEDVKRIFLTIFTWKENFFNVKFVSLLLGNDGYYGTYSYW